MVAELWFRSLWKTQRKHEGGPDVLIGVLAFEVASLMVKLVHIWKSLSDKNIVSLGNVARAVGRIAKKCNDPALKIFEHVFDNLIKCGVYPDGWLFTWKKMERKVKKMERFISMNGNLYQEIESLSDLEHTLMRMKGSDDSAATTLVEYQKKVAWKRQEMKQLKGISLWNRTYDYAEPFKGSIVSGNSSPVKNCLDSGGDYSGALGGTKDQSIINSKHKLLNPSPGTLGFAALALHYANVIIVIERLVASPHLIGHDARDDLYNMLPASVRSALRARLKPYTKSLTSSIYDTVLATEWTDAMSGILEWLAPLAHNMIRWQSERSFEHQNLVSKTNVLLVQTLFGKEINAKAILKCASGRTLDNCLDLDG
ncbi:type-1 restriction enzyme mjaxp r protein [Actinidia rufa]|uniref:Type-1 restriction enzyme mjaxp r protein n=1 Tax=Actinidia rufa TaxID=165716 RepID=A0A7J0GK79_9ERIC|nr:type-1 restriction enzyme mjaxp r protein [Actinidia rufa]